ncbi:MAG: HD domain-containing protein [Deltaproteobacteria bacterium]|nr:HD domain-containing protein [Deltaproteobacteria bacterium]
MTIERRPLNHVWISDIKEDDQVSSLYLVKAKRLGATKKGDFFLSITLADRTGELEAKVWERAEDVSRLFNEGDILEIEGYAGSYRGQLQLILSKLKTVADIEEPDLFLETAKQDASGMMAQLREILRGIEHPRIKALVDQFLTDRKFTALFKKAPAAKNFHHSYIGGLLEHTLSVCRMARTVSQQYPDLDRDLLLAGAFLHDIGKVKELRFGGFIDYTDAGRLIGHLSLGVSMVDEKLALLEGFPEEISLRIKHLILSHHGEFAFGSPKRPKFLEAFALNLIDDLDAKMNGLKRFMERDRQEGNWTEFNRLFDRYFMKSGIMSAAFEKPDSQGRPEEIQGGLFAMTNSADQNQ